MCLSKIAIKLRFNLGESQPWMTMAKICFGLGNRIRAGVPNHCSGDWQCSLKKSNYDISCSKVGLFSTFEKFIYNLLIGAPQTKKVWVTQFNCYSTIAYIDRIRLKYHLLKILQLIIPFIFFHTYFTLPIINLAILKIKQKSTVHLRIN